MKPAAILFILILATWAVVGVLLLSLPSDTQTWTNKHPQFKTMDQTPAESKRHDGLLVYGWLFGTLQILMFASCLALGASRGGRLGTMRWPLMIAALVYLGVFTAVICTYGGYVETPSVPAGDLFPATTAWMLFGISGAPLLFIALYVAGFERWIMTPADQRRFDELVAAKREREGDRD